MIPVINVGSDNLLHIPTPVEPVTVIRALVETPDSSFVPRSTDIVNGAIVVYLYANEAPAARVGESWQVSVSYTAEGVERFAREEFLLVIEGEEPDYDLNKTVEALSAQIGEADPALLRAIVRDVKQFFRNYLHVEELPTQLEPAVRRVAVIRFNQLGSEGLSGESYSGVGQNFMNDVPPDVRRDLYAYRKVAF